MCRHTYHRFYDNKYPRLYAHHLHNHLHNDLRYENNKYLAGGKLTYVMYLCSIDFSDKNFSSLCQIINSEFDDCCRILGLKTRTIFYRLDHSQYKTKLMLILYMITNLLLLLMGPFLLFAGLYFIKSI